MKNIPLSQGKFALVDDEDFEWLNQWKWCAHHDNSTFYAVRHGHLTNGRRDFVRMHREIVRPSHGLMIDHVNGNGLDNQRHNLRIVTHRQNCQNQKNRRLKSSRFPGVSWHRDTAKWEAYIVKDKHLAYLGLFCNEIDAFYRYCDALIQIGEPLPDVLFEPKEAK